MLRDRFDFGFVLWLMLKSALAASSPYRSCRFWPTMFQPSHRIVYAATAKKKPSNRPGPSPPDGVILPD